MKKLILIAIFMVFGFFAFSGKSYAATTMMAKTAFNEATIKWAAVPQAHTYNVYFKEKSAKWWTHSVARLPWNVYWQTIGYLRPGVAYVYRVAAVNDQGVEFWWSAEKPLAPVMRMK